MNKWTEGQLQGNQRGLPPIEPGEVRCPDCYAPVQKRSARKHRDECREIREIERQEIEDYQHARFARAFNS